MSSWNSISMEILYGVLGWISILCWALASYPQVILNFRRKSVVGLSFDYLILNFTKQSSYLIYNATLFFSTTVQKQYFDKYGYDQMIPVALSDVFFPFHSIILILVVSVQIVFFDRGSQKVSKASIAILVAVWFFAGACFFMALPTHSWLWLVSIFNSIQVFMTFIKYSPQAFLNFTRKSTVGFSIGNIVLDFSGGVATLAQMSVQSVDQGQILKASWGMRCVQFGEIFWKRGIIEFVKIWQGNLRMFHPLCRSWVNFLGNIGKPLLALVSIAFDLIFFYQHFVLYHIKASRVSFQRDPESTDSEPLIKDSDHLQGIGTTS
ncbi:cystinosin homolog isoform X1 [Cucumis sativus]|uniref:cystinosin homolog isoform X1 n=1 Tax=Cucumis sativus TaxID=3659 RepID=UPI0005ED33E7|nr:cystinosin homolog isoform X1 [Cucumis sativus]XP_011651581.1 cystinosin homolog isoform X1 [Cucumis sativus]